MTALGIWILSIYLVNISLCLLMFLREEYLRKRFLDIRDIIIAVVYSIVPVLNLILLVLWIWTKIEKIFSRTLKNTKLNKVIFDKRIKQ